jgi:hypothetical protein
MVPKGAENLHVRQDVARPIDSWHSGVRLRYGATAPGTPSDHYAPDSVPLTRPFGGGEQVYRYLGRYAHRVAISNRRLRRIGDAAVSAGPAQPIGAGFAA